jgi:hypothetical protein
MAEHMDLEHRVRDVENRTTALETEHHGVMSDLYGNGQPGLRDSVNNFIMEIRTRDETVKTVLDTHNADVERRDKRRNMLLAAIGLIIAALELWKH